MAVRVPKGSSSAKRCGKYTCWLASYHVSYCTNTQKKTHAHTHTHTHTHTRTHDNTTIIKQIHSYAIIVLLPDYFQILSHKHGENLESIW